MALRKCKECGHEVAKSAKTCPSCGVKSPGKKAPNTQLQPIPVLVALIVFAGIAWFVLDPAVTYLSEDLPEVEVVPIVCDGTAAQEVVQRMAAPVVASVTLEDGWVVVRFGSDWYSWTERLTEGMVRTFADADACLQGRPRRLEFRAPTGNLIARADEVRGIRMMR